MSGKSLCKVSFWRKRRRGMKIEKRGGIKGEKDGLRREKSKQE